MATIFHLDLDAFFVSVERILDPSLVDKPVIVGGNPHGRGVVTACSYETREYGVRSGMPSRRAYQLCPHALFIRSSRGEYSKHSKMVKAIIEQYSPAIEQASVDEFYIDFTGCEIIFGPYLKFATRLQQEILEKTKLPCSIGIGGNKTIAKIASDYNKPQGIVYVQPGMEAEFLRPLPVEVIPGVGKATLQTLHRKGIYKIGDIAKIPQDHMGHMFGKYGMSLWRKANGMGRESISLDYTRKSISHERTYREDVNDIKKIEVTLFRLTGMVCQTLRDKGWEAANVSIKLRYSDFTTITRARTVEATNDDGVVFKVARELFRKNYKRGEKIRLIGVGLTKFTDLNQQTNLFDKDGIKRQDMLNAVNKIREKYGFKSIDLGRL